MATLLAVLAAGAGVALWTASAEADTPQEPAANAQKTRMAITAGIKLNAASSFSILRANQFLPGKGKAKGLGIRLGGGDEPMAALTGSLVPVAIESRDGSVVAYSAWRELVKPKVGEPAQGLKPGQVVGIPSVRLYDAASGRDRLVAMGAHSPALSPEGRLAFFKGDDTPFRVGRPYVGQVLVGATTTGASEQWTSEPAEYFPYAWAAGALLVYKSPAGTEATDLYAFTGPGQSHLVAPEAFVVALSPDGSRVLVTVGRRMVEVVRVADGAIEASMPLDGSGVASEESDTTPHYLQYSGTWRGDRVVANSDLGLVVLTVNEGIRIASVLATPDFAGGVIEPTFTDDDHIIGWARLAGTKLQPSAEVEPTYLHALVACDLAASSCQVGAAEPARPLTRWIGNPSR